VRKIVFVLSLAYGLSGCTLAPSIPADYWGPQAEIRDSYTANSEKTADFFYLDKINGEKIEDSLRATNQASRGKGAKMTPIAVERNVPARKATFEIVGRTHYVAPIDQVLRTIYEVRGEIEFSPLPNQSYTVRGHIFDNGSKYDNYLAVWIEETKSGEVVAQKIVMEGIPSLGFFRKLTD
jgi:hypothetical protein